MSPARVTALWRGPVAELVLDHLADDSAELLAEVVAAVDTASRAERVQVTVAPHQSSVRRALQRIGFRRDGVLRSALQADDGTRTDALVYGRLLSDATSGPQAFSSVMDSVLPTKRVIGHAVFVDQVGRVLLTETVYKSDWELPGGVVEPHETPREGCRREVFEELGIDVSFGQPALVDWMPPYLGWSDAIEFVFDGGRLAPGTIATLQPCDAEIRALHWVAPEELDSRVTPLSARRIRLVLAGARGMTEDGHLVE